MDRRNLSFRVAGIVALQALAVSLAILPVGCNSQNAKDNIWPDKPGPKVVVSFAPLYCFAVNVAGDDAVVKNVMTTTGPHDFNPTAEDVKLVTKADIFFIMGLGLDETSAEKMKSGSGNQNLKIVELGEQIPKELRLEGTCNHAHEPGHVHEHGDDPHMWLDPDYAVRMVEMIRDELKAKDPAHAAGYESRATAYIEKLKKLKTDGLAMFQGKQKPRLVTFHDSLAYFEKSFGLNVRGVLTKKPGQEPDPTEMKKLIKICSNPDNPVRVIATEPQYSTSNSAETLRKELASSGVKDVILVEFDPLETVRPDELTADWYERKMRVNLETLSKAFK